MFISRSEYESLKRQIQSAELELALWKSKAECPKPSERVFSVFTKSGEVHDVTAVRFVAPGSQSTFGGSWVSNHYSFYDASGTLVGSFRDDLVFSVTEKQ